MRLLPLLAASALLSAGCPDEEPPCGELGCSEPPGQPYPPSSLTGGVVAVGGTATYQASGHDPRAGALHARVVAGAVEIEAVSLDRVTVRADAPGSATLALSVGDGPERSFPIVADSLASVALQPYTSELLPAGLGEWAFFVGDDRRVALTLIGSAGATVTDEGAEVFADAALRPQGWNGFALDRLVAGVVPITIIAGRGQELEATVAVVDAADRLALEGAAADQLTVNQRQTYCFRARAGATTVLGAAWSFATEGAVVLSTTVSPPNCVDLIALEQGAAALVARAAGQELVLAITVQSP